MSGPPPPHVDLSPGLNDWLEAAASDRSLERKFKKVKKAIEIMRNHGPSYPGFHSHPMKHLGGHDGRRIWNSYLENHNPQAWRMFWVYDDKGGIYVLSVGPHDHVPDDQP